MIFQLLRNASGGDTLAKAIEKEITTCAIDSLQPLFCFHAQRLGDIDTAYLATLRVDVVIAHLHVFYFDLHKFAPLAPVAAKKRTTKYHSKLSSAFNLFFKKR